MLNNEVLLFDAHPAPECYKSVHFALIFWVFNPSQTICHRLCKIAHGAIATAWSTVVEVHTEASGSPTAAHMLTTAVPRWATMELLKGKRDTSIYPGLNTHNNNISAQCKQTHTVNYGGFKVTFETLILNVVHLPYVSASHNET